MKTYTFFYYDSVHEFRSDKKSEYVVTASRFPVAFKAFCNFIIQSSFWYFTFLNTYKICSDGRISYRVLPSKCHLVLDKMRKLKDD